MNINYEYYKIFYYVAKTASISAAAKELCVSQPAVSQAVKSLEQAIGINLFIRTKKGVSLTGAGELLFKHGNLHGRTAACQIDALGNRRDPDRSQ